MRSRGSGDRRTRRGIGIAIAHCRDCDRDPGRVRARAIGSEQCAQALFAAISPPLRPRGWR
jgi:hypothetical protein